MEKIVTKEIIFKAFNIALDNSIYKDTDGGVITKELALLREELIKILFE